MGRDLCPSNGLIQCINNKGIFFWNQSIKKWHGYIPIWKRSWEMGLQGQIAREWEKIRFEIKLVGVSWEAGGDQIAWFGKMKEGVIVVANVYNTLCN